MSLDLVRYWSHTPRVLTVSCVTSQHVDRHQLMIHMLFDREEAVSWLVLEPVSWFLATFPLEHPCSSTTIPDLPARACQAAGSSPPRPWFLCLTSPCRCLLRSWNCVHCLGKNHLMYAAIGARGCRRALLVKRANVSK